MSPATHYQAGYKIKLVSACNKWSALQMLRNSGSCWKFWPGSESPARPDQGITLNHRLLTKWTSVLSFAISLFPRLEPHHWFLTHDSTWLLTAAHFLGPWYPTSPTMLNILEPTARILAVRGTTVFLWIWITCVLLLELIEKDLLLFHCWWSFHVEVPQLVKHTWPQLSSLIRFVSFEGEKGHE